MWTLILILSATLLALRMWSMNTEDDTMKKEDENDSSITYVKEFTVYLFQYCINLPYILYSNITLLSVTIFLLKYVPTGLYLYKFINDVVLTSRQRVKQKRTEIEDIEGQIQVVNSKLYVRNAEFVACAEQLRRSTERLRKIRARVRDFIASDEAMRQTIVNNAHDDIEQVTKLGASLQEEDRDYLVELLLEYKHDKLLPKPDKPEKLDCSERAQTDPNTPENSVYSSLSDVDIRQDCRVKIVKITNVYKVAYLKHYIKQKRLRRATKQALLKKKIESIKSLLEDWQKTLNMVINNKLSLLSIDNHPIDVVSQEAMGDYSKPRESSDTDSDIRNSWSDLCYDEYNINWAQNPYKPYLFNEELPETADLRDCHDCQDYGDGNHSSPPMNCDCSMIPSMMAIVEETKSQLAIEETKSEQEDTMDYTNLAATSV